jgi:hypothetical protein
LPGADGKAFLLEAQDAATNASQAEVKVQVDRTPPQLEIASPGEGVVLGGLPVVVQGTVQDASETSVTVNGTPATRNGDAWQASFDGLGEGGHSFGVVAVTRRGRSATRNVSLDLLPPVVTIDSPDSGTLTKESSIAVLGTAVDRTLRASGHGTGGARRRDIQRDGGSGRGRHPILAVAPTPEPGRAGAVTVTGDRTAPVVGVQAEAW